MMARRARQRCSCSMTHWATALLRDEERLIAVSAAVESILLSPHVLCWLDKTLLLIAQSLSLKLPPASPLTTPSNPVLSTFPSLSPAPSLSLPINNSRFSVFSPLHAHSATIPAHIQLLLLAFCSFNSQLKNISGRSDYGHGAAPQA